MYILLYPVSLLSGFRDDQTKFDYLDYTGNQLNKQQQAQNQKHKSDEFFNPGKRVCFNSATVLCLRILTEDETSSFGFLPGLGGRKDWFYRFNFVCFAEQWVDKDSDHDNDM